MACESPGGRKDFSTMSGKHMFTIRPLSRPARADFKDAFRICFSASALLSLNLRPGDLCQIDPGDGNLKTAVAWSATEKIQETVVQTSKTLQEIYGIKLGDKIQVAIYDGPVPEASEVHLKVDDVAPSDSGVDVLGDEKSHWEWFLDMPLSRAEWLAAGMTFDTDVKGQKHRFKVIRIQSQSSPPSSLFRFADSSLIRIVSAEDSNTTEESQKASTFVLDRALIGGLHRQREQIERALRRFGSSTAALKLPEYYRPAQGLLLYGPKGTGKSLLVDCIAACSWRKVCRLESIGTRESISSAILKVFSEARKSQPGLILIDQIEALTPKRTSYDYNATSSVAGALRKGFDAIQGSDILVVAETRHPNEIDETLRSPGRFGLEVEVMVPTLEERYEILQVIRGNSSEPSTSALREISQRTHGYVGADLVALLNLCVELAEDRTISTSDLGSTIAQDITFIGNTESAREGEEQSVIPIHITDADIAQALMTIRPTALQEIFLSTPHTPWSSIGGYESIKKHLQNTVARPLRFPEQMARFNLRARKGLLLYGPPGCSKTLLVKALATESGLNFLAVKGAEILSMYVGESERAVREIFRKARAASPSIIFFDEIDAIASTRGSSSGGNSGVNVLTTLLNELDGIEELKNVLVVAATNTPQNVDPALLRPGRLDHLLYVGLPDFEARMEILTIWFEKSMVADNLKTADVVDSLAETLDGHSGAEIVGICETAGNLAMDRYEQVIDRNGGDLPTGDSDVVIELRDLEEAKQRTRKGVTTESVRGFMEWSKGRG